MFKVQSRVQKYKIWIVDFAESFLRSQKKQCGTRGNTKILTQAPLECFEVWANVLQIGVFEWMLQWDEASFKSRFTVHPLLSRLSTFKYLLSGIKCRKVPPAQKIIDLSKLIWINKRNTFGWYVLASTRNKSITAKWKNHCFRAKWVLLSWIEICKLESDANMSYCSLIEMTTEKNCFLYQNIQNQMRDEYQFVFLPLDASAVNLFTHFDFTTLFTNFTHATNIFWISFLL